MRRAKSRRELTREVAWLRVHYAQLHLLVHQHIADWSHDSDEAKECHARIMEAMRYLSDEAPRPRGYWRRKTARLVTPKVPVDSGIDPEDIERLLHEKALPEDAA